jgi:hypothetical protein
MNTLKHLLFLVALCTILIINNSCKKKNLAIGDSYDGGIIFYILVDGDPGYSSRHVHGLIASTSDLLPGARWGCEGTSIPGTEARAIGSGFKNTESFVKGCSESDVAARLCHDLKLNGKDDWFLPSIDELQKLYLNRSVVPGTTTYPYSSYWSSTQYNNVHAWAADFKTGQLDYTYKIERHDIRPIRAF